MIWLLPVLFPRPHAPEPGGFHLWVLDVGQGLAAVVRTRNHLLLYDTGPGFSSGFNTGWAVIVPFLRDMGQDNIDIIVQSHGDSDHIGGLQDVLSSMETGEVLTSVPGEVVFDRRRRCLAGQQWVWDGVPFRILHPSVDEGPGENDSSCVVKVGTGKHSVLLTGDIEARSENKLVMQYGDRLQAGVLVAPHHGSATSSTSEFIQSVAPDFVIFSAGYLNRYNFPKQDIIARYQDNGVTILDTASNGAISIIFTRETIAVTKERERSPRFWNGKD
jgi:competence protein ComEC